MLDKVVSIFIGIGSVFTGVLLASWICHYLFEFMADEVFDWNRRWTQERFLLKDYFSVLVGIILMVVAFGFLTVAISYGVFQLVDGFFNALQTFEFQLFE